MQLFITLVGLQLAVAPTTPPGKTTPASAPASSAPDKSAKIDALVTRLQRHYDSTKSFEADFEQTYTSKVFRRQERSAGHVSYRRPGQMRFDYRTPTEKSFLVDGKALWIIQPADHQALVDRCFKSDALTSSLTFLFGEGRLDEQFKIKPGKKSPPGLVRLILDPRTPQGAYRRLLLDVDPEEARVVVSTVVDQQANTNRFRFKQAVYDKEVDASRFTYDPPPGITVMPLPGSCRQ